MRSQMTKAKCLCLAMVACPFHPTPTTPHRLRLLPQQQHPAAYPSTYSLHLPPHPLLVLHSSHRRTQILPLKHHDRTLWRSSTPLVRVNLNSNSVMAPLRIQISLDHSVVDQHRVRVDSQVPSSSSSSSDNNHRHNRVIRYRLRRCSLLSNNSKTVIRIPTRTKLSSSSKRSPMHLRIW